MARKISHPEGGRDDRIDQVLNRPREVELADAIKKIDSHLRELLGDQLTGIFTEDELVQKLGIRREEGLVKRLLEKADAGKLPDGRIQVTLRAKPE